MPAPISRDIKDSMQRTGLQVWQITYTETLVGFSRSDEGPTLETLDFTIRIGSTPTFSYFDLRLYSTYAAH